VSGIVHYNLYDYFISPNLIIYAYHSLAKENKGVKTEMRSEGKGGSGTSSGGGRTGFGGRWAGGRAK
jgi:uncharacterized membrane protein YgcG